MSLIGGGRDGERKDVRFSGQMSRHCSIYPVTIVTETVRQLFLLWPPYNRVSEMSRVARGG